MTSLPEMYVAVDVEADGPIPGPYSLPHTHHAGEDAAELAQVFQAVLDHGK